MKKHVLLILIALGIGIVGTTLYRFDPAEACDYRTYPIRKIADPLPPPRPIPQDGLSKYRSDEYRFGLFYPSHFRVDEFPEVGGAKTIVFQDPKTFEGFQIFIVPYRNPGIVPRRLERDVAGAILNMATTSVDGICARAFDTHNPLLADTSEVWIARDGNLFEITAYSEHRSILEDVIASWRFL